MSVAVFDGEGQEPATLTLEHEVANPVRGRRQKRQLDPVFGFSRGEDLGKQASAEVGRSAAEIRRRQGG